MPLLPPSSVVHALTESTRQYLAWLDSQHTVTQGQPITEIVAQESGKVSIDGELWVLHSARMASQLRISLEVPAVIRTAALEAEIRIITYSREDGALQFACREAIQQISGHLIDDFRWLTKRVLKWLESRGLAVGQITGKAVPTITAIKFEPGTDEEKQCAVEGVLSNWLSYVWGPPGTGKSSHVLAPAVRACIASGHRVFVLAPTNLAVDHALDAVLKLLELPCQVLRLGVPTEGFSQKWPQCCETKVSQSSIAQLEADLALHRSEISDLEGQALLLSELSSSRDRLNVLTSDLGLTDQALTEAEPQLGSALEAKRLSNEVVMNLERRQCSLETALQGVGLALIEKHVRVVESEHAVVISEMQALEFELSSLSWYHVFTNRRSKAEAKRGELLKRRSSVEDTLEGLRMSREQARIREGPLKQELQNVKICIQGSSTKAQADARNAEILGDKVAVLRRQSQKLNEEARLLCANIAAATQKAESCLSSEARQRRIVTLSALIEVANQQLENYRQDLSDKRVLGMTLDAFIGMSMGHGTLSADRVFVDEAAYAPLAKVIPLLSLNCPITLLGDHRQLPPICQNENDPVILSYWGQSAILMENAFRCGDDYNALASVRSPQLEVMPQFALTRTYRFGESLANLLDRTVYGNIGLRGLGSATRIETVDCPPRILPGETERRNVSEAEQIVDRIRRWLNWTNPDEETLVVLTPYKAQVQLIRQTLRRAGITTERIEILNVHKAQGREWDWVLVSAVDTDRLARNRPWFTDDSNPASRGLEVLNTALSRAKKHLFVFMDKQFWAERWDQSAMLSHIARSLTPDAATND